MMHPRDRHRLSAEPVPAESEEVTDDTTTVLACEV